MQVHSVPNKSTDPVWVLYVRINSCTSHNVSITLSQFDMRNLKIRAFENQRIIFLVEFLSLAKLHSSACLFTKLFPKNIAQYHMKKWNLVISCLRVLFDWHVIWNSACFGLDIRQRRKICPLAGDRSPLGRSQLQTGRTLRKCSFFSAFSCLEILSLDLEERY